MNANVRRELALLEATWAQARPAGFDVDADVAELAAVGPLRTRYSNVTIGRMGVRTTGGVFDLPGAVLINAGNSTEFTQAWR